MTSAHPLHFRDPPVLIERPPQRGVNSIMARLADEQAPTRFVDTDQLPPPFSLRILRVRRLIEWHDRPRATLWARLARAWRAAREAWRK